MTRTVAGHEIRDTSGLCDACGRSVHDVMSAAVGASLGDEGVACVGRLNGAEMRQIEEERERRDRLWAELLDVAA